MKPVDLGTLVVVVIFFVGMTFKNNEYVKFQKVEEMKRISAAAAELEGLRIKANTLNFIIPYDSNIETRTVTVTLDASSTDDQNGISTYMWRQSMGPRIDISEEANKKSITFTVGEGEFEFECIITGPYGKSDIDKKRVIISREPNNPSKGKINGFINP